MKDIAWIGQLNVFCRQFYCHSSPFIDESNGIRYYCIAKDDDMRGRRFDEVRVGYFADPFDYYNRLYQEVLNTRIKKGN